LCFLAALIVEASEAASRGGGYSAARIVGAVVAVPLVILLVVSSVERVRVLLPENLDELSAQRRVAPEATEMIDWMSENIPEGKSILVVAEPAINAAQANYLMFLDGGRHEWKPLRMDQGICIPRPNIQIRCDPGRNVISRIPRDVVWVESIGLCRVSSLSMPNLLEQVGQSQASYIVISGSHVFPSILELPLPLQESDAFEVVHAEPNRKAGSSAKPGVVLLKSTGRAPRAVPTQMDVTTVLGLRRCAQAKGSGYAEMIRSKFPNGIRVRTVS
jgi:hypothetical protein